MDPGEAGAVVKRAVHGDAIVVEVNGREHRVSYTGVDAPESAARRSATVSKRYAITNPWSRESRPAGARCQRRQ
ncbi:MAG: hypothetical protein CUN48_03250 [Candidatus Thermofonsia Clade 3 bacterium]|uniref:Uncharacterized protein n=1 Tax=Candidatus Thermofonsia Clade 3 bacterium TaxID=2364212 RepID=A0A2M8QFB9_9CHLR|nr:MAG: hypothetical protein CUN48_03250 [Candidatus Thermofonsia Clade 3 bacterium]